MGTLRPLAMSSAKAGGLTGVLLPSFLLALCLLLPLAAFAQTLPALTGRVVDNAGLVDPVAEAALVQKLEAFEQKSSDQIVVATIASLGGEAIEPFANRLFRAWGLGQAGEDNGILLLVARDDRKMRIEVGYGLEPVLPDSLVGSIIRSEFTPAFKEGNYGSGILRGVCKVAEIVRRNHRLTAEEKKALRSPATPRTEESFREKLGGWLALAGIAGGCLLALGIGCWTLGSGIRTREANGIIFGLAFTTLWGGTPILMAIASGSAMNILLVLLLVVPAATLMIVGGYRKPLRSFDKSSGLGGGSSPGDGRSSGRGFSGGGGGDFGGGSSGGGGASGKW